MEFLINSVGLTGQSFWKKSKYEIRYIPHTNIMGTFRQQVLKVNIETISTGREFCNLGMGKFFLIMTQDLKTTKDR